MRPGGWSSAVALLMVLATACGARPALVRIPPPAVPAAVQTAVPQPVATPPPTPPPPVPVVPVGPVTPAPEPEPTLQAGLPATTADGRTVHATGYQPFATVEGVVLFHPSAAVELIGFHQSNHEGARELTPLATAAAPLTLESRDRLTTPHSAADIVADPTLELRSPVTGTVKRAGSYILYCDHTDYFAVIEPDARPGWEVKLLHIADVLVQPGDRVEAGVTVLASRLTQLPFQSQVDELTAEPSWPHTHVEVVDPAIPNIPSPGGGC